MKSIQIVVGDSKPVVLEVGSNWNWSRIDAEAEVFCRVLSATLLSALMVEKDDELACAVPAGWENRGKEGRELLTSARYVRIERRVYRDEEGRRHKPLDEALQLGRYEGISPHVKRVGAYLASRATYRVSAEMLGERTGEAVTPTRIQRIVWTVGEALDAEEAAEREAVFERGAELAGGGVEAPVLFGESDGTPISLQREGGRRKIEARIGVMYKEKTPIGKGRRVVKDKVVVTALVDSSEEWQEMLLKAAHSHYRLESTKLLVVGGDGAQWVRHSFDRLEVPELFQLDPYHLYRAAKRVGGTCQAEMAKVVKRARVEGFAAIEAELRTLTMSQQGKAREKAFRFYGYLENNQDGLVGWGRQLGLADGEWTGLGVIEGNVDKLVVQRMKGRGMSWRIPGARGMLALCRNRAKLRERAFAIPVVSPFGERSSSPRGSRRSRQRDADWLRHDVPIIHSHLENDPEVQWLRRRINGEPILSFPTPSP